VSSGSILKDMKENKHLRNISEKNPEGRKPDWEQFLKNDTSSKLDKVTPSLDEYTSNPGRAVNITTSSISKL
jgi:hypothetical protein